MSSIIGIDFLKKINTQMAEEKKIDKITPFTEQKNAIMHKKSRKVKKCNFNIDTECDLLFNDENYNY
jgi:hypothetical protein